MTDMLQNDPIVARSFYLEIPGDDKMLITGVSGIEIELDVVPFQTNGKNGKQQHIKTLGGILKAPDLSITRMAPAKMDADPLWKWFNLIRSKGMKIARASSAVRKNGSIVLYDTTYTEVGRYNWFNGWISKIAVDAMSTDSNDPVKETITLVIERIERIK